MKRIASLLLGTVTIFCFMIATEHKAWGYVDPGSGLLALQGVASVLGTVAYYFRRRLRALFDRKPKQKPVAYPAKPGHEPQSAA